MSFRNIAQIAGSAMTAQTTRLNTIASNLANAESASGNEASTYHARKPVFSALSGGKVQVLDVVESAQPLRKAHEPSHPLADADGNVFYPNVSPVEEMTDMMSASRAFQTNVEILSRVKGMQQDLLKMGEG